MHVAFLFDLVFAYLLIIIAKDVYHVKIRPKNSHK